MWSSSLCGISFLKLCLHFLLLNSFLLLTAQSGDWSGLVSTALFCQEKEKRFFFVYGLCRCCSNVIICKSPWVQSINVQLLTQFSNITVNNSLVGAFLSFRLLRSMLNILFIFLPAAKFCFCSTNFLVK